MLTPPERRFFFLEDATKPYIEPLLLDAVKESDYAPNFLRSIKCFWGTIASVLVVVSGDWLVNHTRNGM